MTIYKPISAIITMIEQVMYDSDGDCYGAGLALIRTLRAEEEEAMAVEAAAKPKPRAKRGYHFQTRGAGNCSIPQRRFYLGLGGDATRGRLFKDFQYGLLTVNQVARPDADTLVFTHSDSVFIRSQLDDAGDPAVYRELEAATEATCHIMPHNMTEDLPRKVALRHHALYQKIPFDLVDGFNLSPPEFPNIEPCEYWLPGQPWLQWLQVCRAGWPMWWGTYKHDDGEQRLVLRDDFQLITTKLHTSHVPHTEEG